MLAEKLRDRGFPHSQVIWPQNRSAFVKVRLTPDEHKIRGVPQGTVLRPLLLNTFVSDFDSSHNDVTVIKYADDINIVINFTEKDPKSIKRKIKREITAAISWCKNKKMVLNTEKSSCSLNFREDQYHPASPPLPEKKSIKMLGICLNNKLN